MESSRAMLTPSSSTTTTIKEQLLQKNSSEEKSEEKNKEKSKKKNKKSEGWIVLTNDEETIKKLKYELKTAQDTIITLTDKLQKTEKELKSQIEKNKKALAYEDYRQKESEMNRKGSHPTSRTAFSRRGGRNF